MIESCERHPDRPAYRMDLCRDCYSGKPSSHIEEVGGNYRGDGFEKEAPIEWTPKFGVQEVLNVVADAFDVPVEAIFSHSHSPAKSPAIYLIRRTLSLSLKMIGKQFDIHFSTVSDHIKRVQKRMRDSEEYRKLIQALVDRLEVSNEVV